MEESIFAISPKKIKNKKSAKNKKIAAIIVFILAAVTFLVVATLNHISAVIVSICDAKVKSVSMEAINKAVIQVLSGSIKYSDLITVQKDSAGDIALIETNSVLVNRLARDTAEVTSENLKAFADFTVDIPIGQLTNIAFLANTGPSVSVRLIPQEMVNCTFESEFEEAGINQTRHKIFLNIDAAVQLILPTSAKTIQTRAEVLVCESLLVGKVPEVYLDFGNFGGKLNLTPQNS